MKKLDNKNKTLVIVGVIVGVMTFFIAVFHFLKNIAEEFEEDEAYYGYGPDWLGEDLEGSCYADNDPDRENDG